MTTAMNGRRVFGAAAMVLVLAGCGGSDPSIDNANQGCNVTEQKSWLRSYMLDWYYWTGRSLDPDPADYASVADLFKGELFKGSGAVPADKWSYILGTSSFNQYFGDGVTVGYGIAVNGVELKALLDAGTPKASLPPMKVRFVDPGSPAAAALVTRGDVVNTINGISAADFIAADDYTALSATANGQTLRIGLNGVASPLVLSSTTFSLAPVTAAQTLTLSNGKKAGYLALKEFVTQAEAPLASAFASFASDGATELILDLRYNGGGLISTSSVLASLVAGVSRNNQVFAHLAFNSKHTDSNGDYRFNSATSTPYTRVIVLTGSRTCSASELVVNGLKGVSPAVQVVTIGDTSCGKPFGFQPRNNCSSTYSAVNFESTNALGNGQYYNGIAATCAVADDFTGVMGNPTEKLTAAAVSYLQTDACPSTGTGRQSPLSLPRSRTGRTTEPGERQGMFAN